MSSCGRLSGLADLSRFRAWLPGLAVILTGFAAQAEQMPNGETRPVTASFTCLGEQVCSELPPDSTPRGRELANEVLEAVYDLPESEQRFFLEKRRDAQGFAIFPDVGKSGMMGATIHGHGIMAYRNEDGSWSPPIILTIEGQSMGPQFGTQSSHVIFIFKTQCGVKDFLTGHHHFVSNGVEVTIEHVGDVTSAEPMGITVHAFERGMLLGQSFDRFSIHIDEDANAALYGVALKPGCIIEGVRTGVRRPWFQRYFEKLNQPPDMAHSTIESRDLPVDSLGNSNRWEIPARPEMPGFRGSGR